MTMHRITLHAYIHALNIAYVTYITYIAYAHARTPTCIHANMHSQCMTLIRQWHAPHIRSACMHMCMRVKHARLTCIHARIA